jgi:hypothetical protein
MELRHLRYFVAVGEGSITGVRRADYASLSRHYPARFTIWRKNWASNFSTAYRAA